MHDVASIFSNACARYQPQHTGNSFFNKCYGFLPADIRFMLLKTPVIIINLLVKAFGTSFEIPPNQMAVLFA